MHVIDQKLVKDKHQVMHELILFYDLLESFGRGFAYPSCELLQLGKNKSKKHSLFSLIII